MSCYGRVLKCFPFFFFQFRWSIHPPSHFFPFKWWSSILPLNHSIRSSIHVFCCRSEGLDFGFHSLLDIFLSVSFPFPFPFPFLPSSLFWRFISMFVIPFLHSRHLHSYHLHPHHIHSHHLRFYHPVSLFSLSLFRSVVVQRCIMKEPTQESCLEATVERWISTMIFCVFTSEEKHGWGFLGQR